PCRSLSRYKVVRCVKEYRVYLEIVDEIRNLDDPRALDRHFFKVLGGQLYVLAFFVFIAFDNLFVRQHFALDLTNVLVANPTVVLLVEKMERYTLAAGRRINADGNIDESKLDGAAPYCSHLICSPFLRGSEVKPQTSPWLGPGAPQDHAIMLATPVPFASRLKSCVS